MKTKPDLSFWKLWNLSFGFFGVQIAYALQSGNVSRIFTSIGADPHDLSYFWILPPLMGLVVQPIVGMMSDKTWNRFGRRLPYLIFGAIIATAVLCLFPNAGSFHFALSGAILFGLVALMLLDTSLNMAMQPFKMLVGDMVNEKQKGKAYSIQSFLCNAGQVIGFGLPFVLTWIGFANTPKNEGEVADSVIWSFYIGAAILICCVIYTMMKVKEWDPKTYNDYNNISSEKKETKSKQSLISIIRNAPLAFWTVGLVQFFCWFAFLYLWTYGSNSVAMQAFETPPTQSVTGVQTQNEIMPGKNIIISQNGTETLIVQKGKELVKGVEADGKFYPASLIIVNKDTIVNDYRIQNNKDTGIAKVEIGNIYGKGTIQINNDTVITVDYYNLKNFLYNVSGSGDIITAEIVKVDKDDPIKFEASSTTKYPVNNLSECRFEKKTELNTTSKSFNDAGNWFGFLLAAQALASVAWAAVLPKLGSRKFSYIISLILGGIGFILSAFLTNQYLLFIPYALMGCAWAAMLAWPFTILTNSLKGGNIGTYLGLFNCTICIPQIVAAIVGGWILACFGSTSDGLAPQYWMMVIGGISLIIGSICVFFIKEGPGKEPVRETPVISEEI